MGEERYAIEQIIDAITQADEEIIQAVRYKDKEMLGDVLKDYLRQRFLVKACAIGMKRAWVR